MPQAISYIRFSSIQQGSGSSTERQKAMVAKWLDANPNYTYSSLSVADLGVSAFSGDHLKYGLGGILEAIEEKKLIKAGDVILIESIDRLGRLPIGNMQDLINSIIRYGVAIVTLEDNITYSQDTINNDYSLSFILLGKIQQAHNYSRNLSRRISGAYESKRRKAKEGQPIKLIVPFWLDKDHKLKQKESEIMLEAINLYLAGKGYRAITKQYDGYFDERSLKRWFTHKALIGVWQNGNDPIPNVFEPLIDEATYYKLQHVMKQRERVPSPENFYHLQSLIKCSCCNASFHFRRKQYKDKFIVYANCSTFIRKGKSACNNGLSWSYDLLSYLYQIHLESVAPSLYLTSNDKAIEEKEIELSLKINEVSKYIDDYTDAIASVGAIPEVLSKLKQYQSECDALYAEQQALRDRSGRKKLSFNFNQSGVDASHKEAVKSYLKDLDADPIKKHLLLKENQVFLFVNDRTIKAGLHTYHLIKRSTRHNCYILKRAFRDVAVSMSKLPDSEDHNLKLSENHNQLYTLFIAIRGDRLIARASTITDLEKKLMLVNNSIPDMV